METSGSIGTWKRYKLGQAQFTKWLKQTADKVLAGSASNGAAKAAPKPSPKHNQKGQNTSSTNIHWSQLESMAKTIVEHGNPNDIPESSISILRDVVTLRKKSARFFGSVAVNSDDEKLKRSNTSHEHIIKVLEKILVQFEALKAAVSKVTGAAETKKPRPDAQLNMDDINNMFELLKVDEAQDVEDDISEESGSDKPASTSKSKKKKLPKKHGKKQKSKKQPKGRPATATTEASSQSDWVEDFQWTDDENEDEFDYYMLVYCFFEDFNTVREYVVEKWCDYYYYQSVPIQVLAVITNAACEIFHEMERELFRTIKALKQSPAMVHYEAMMSMLFFEYGLDHVEYGDESLLSKAELRDKIHREADWLGFMAYTSLQDILNNVPLGKVPLIPADAIRRPTYGTLNSDGLASFIKSVVMEMLPEVCIIKAMKTNGQVPSIIGAQDEITLDFEESLRVRKYPSSMVFGLQLFADIRYVLEHDVINAFTQMQTTGRRAGEVLNRHWETLRASRLKTEMYARRAEIDCIILEDFTEQDKIKRWTEAGVQEYVEPHVFLKRHPIWAGLLEFRCQLVMNNLGYRLISASTVFLAGAFAYSSTRLESGDRLSWPSMDNFFRVHGEDRVLQGTVPVDSTAFDLLKRFTDFNLAHTKAEAVADFTKPSKTFDALYERYGEDSHRSRQDMKYLREIIRDNLDIDVGRVLPLRKKTTAPAENDNNGTSEASTESTSDRRGPVVDESAIREIQMAVRSHTTSPIELLEILSTTTGSLLESQLSVDYFQVYDESVLYLQTLLEEFSVEAEGCAIPPPDDSVHVDKLAKLIPAIFKSMDGGNTAAITGKLVRGTEMFISKIAN